jgi:ubiquinone/menaquinone biosynthesis C-methylase UbiE
MKRTAESFKEEFDEFNEYFTCDKNFSFMNHGYSPISDTLKSSDILLKQCAMLYDKTTEGLQNNSGESLLEIGCGRGGGLNFIKKKYPNLSISGCDISPKNIVNSIFFDESSLIQYSVANSMDLPYKDSSFDYLLNVESSHCYADIDKFYSECARVMKPNGTFFYSDLVWNIEMLNENHKHIQKYFNVASFTDITENVLQSCIEISDILEPYKNIPVYNYMYRLFLGKQNVYKNENYFIIMKLTPKE